MNALSAITVDDLLNLGYTEESFESKNSLYTIHWRLSNLTGLYADGREDKIFRNPFGKSREEIAKNKAIEDLKKNLEELLNNLSEDDKKEILEMKRYKAGEPQNTIKIEKFGDKYRASFYVRGDPNHIESFSANIVEDGEHFVVEYQHTIMDRPNNHNSTNKSSETYHDRKIAHNTAMDTIKSRIKDLMAFHGMDEAKTVNFELIKK